MGSSLPPQKPQSRRQVLCLLAVGSAGCAAAGLSGCPTEPGPSDDDDSWQGPDPITLGPVDVGDISDFPEGSIINLERERIAVGRDNEGLWALSLTCPHLGCNIGDEEAGGMVTMDLLHCGCHGSQFDSDGFLELGPANRSLTNLLLTFEEERVIVDTSQEVPAFTRAAAPDPS